MAAPLKAQLRSSSGRSSKIIKDRERVEAIVEVAGVGRLVLCIDSGGGYSLRGSPESDETPARDLLAAGVIRAKETGSVLPEGRLGEHEPS